MRSRLSLFEPSARTLVRFAPTLSTAAANSESLAPVTNTCAPSFTNCLAVARPMPLLPSVISAIFPLSLAISFSFQNPFVLELMSPLDIPQQLNKDRVITNDDGRPGQRLFDGIEK